VPIFDQNTRLRSLFFSPAQHCRIESKQNVCVQEANLGKVAKSCYRSDQGKYFKKINQNYFAHICPEYGFRVKKKKKKS